MSEPDKKVDLPVVTLTRSELRQIVLDAVKEAVAASPGEDKLLNVRQVAAILNCKPDWIYHNMKTLPFTRKVGGLLRFSANGLQRYIENKKSNAKGH